MTASRRAVPFSQAQRALSENRDAAFALSAGVAFGLLPERQADIAELAREIRKPVPNPASPWRRGPNCGTPGARESFKRYEERGHALLAPRPPASKETGR